MNINHDTEALVLASALLLSLTFAYECILAPTVNEAVKQHTSYYEKKFYRKVTELADKNKDGDVSALELNKFYSKLAEKHNAEYDRSGFEYNTGEKVPIDSVVTWVLGEKQ